MKWIGRIFLILFALLAGFVAVSAGLAYVAGQYWREAVHLKALKPLDERFHALLSDRIAISDFSEAECRDILAHYDVARWIWLERSVTDTRRALAEREACGMRLTESDRLRAEWVAIHGEGATVGGTLSVFESFFNETVRFTTHLLWGEWQAIGYGLSRASAGLPGQTVLVGTPADSLALAERFLRGEITPGQVRHALLQLQAAEADELRAHAEAHAFHADPYVRELAFVDLFGASRRGHPDAIWQIEERSRTPENCEFQSELPYGGPCQGIRFYDENTSRRLRYAVARGHTEATRAFLENGWDSQGEDANGDGIVWNDPFSTPYWWAVHAVRLDDPAFADDLDAALAHLEAQGCADHARAVGEAWRGVLADLWSDHTPVNALIRERPDCAGPQDSEPAGFEHSDTRFDDPLYDLPELMIALDLSL